MGWHSYNQCARQQLADGPKRYGPSSLTVPLIGNGVEIDGGDNLQAMLSGDFWQGWSRGPSACRVHFLVGNGEEEQVAGAIRIGGKCLENGQSRPRPAFMSSKPRPGRKSLSDRSADRGNSLNSSFLSNTGHPPALPSVSALFASLRMRGRHRFRLG